MAAEKGEIEIRCTALPFDVDHNIIPTGAIVSNFLLYDALAATRLLCRPGTSCNDHKVDQVPDVFTSGQCLVRSRPNTYLASLTLFEAMLGCAARL